MIPSPTTVGLLPLTVMKSLQAPESFTPATPQFWVFMKREGLRDAYSVTPASTHSVALARVMWPLTKALFGPSVTNLTTLQVWRAAPMRAVSTVVWPLLSSGIQPAGGVSLVACWALRMQLGSGSGGSVGSGGSIASRSAQSLTGSPAPEAAEGSTEPQV